MKKILFSLVVLVSLYQSKLYAGSDPRSYQLWRSTEISGTTANFRVATSAIILADITVTSGTTADTAQFQYRNSSDTAVGFSGSTSTVYDIDTTGDYFPIGEQLGYGLIVTKTGTGAIRVRWNWVTSPPKGQESRGTKD